MKVKKTKLLKKNQLSNLVNRFSKSYVIEEMERNLQQNKSTELLVTNIDDNAYLKSAPIRTEVLRSIADSLEKHMTSPLVVRPKKEYYEVVFGRKRLLACKKYKIAKVPVIIIKIADEEMLLMLLADIRAQADANTIEMGLILKELAEKYNFRQKTLAGLAHQSRSQITNILRILNLPKHILDDISLNKLSYGHAKAIASLPETRIEELVERIYKEKLSVRDIEQIVKEQHTNQDDNRTLLLNKYQCKVTNKDKAITINFVSNKEKDNFLKDLNR
ncbi:MAG: ParB/RepB/Spo0J family partition protein [Bacilli bacterium]|nr:ParB/RepB/Spo0J family partition protein [Bacilli bacterium]